MCDKEFKELVKIAVEKLKDESVLKLLQADASYQKDSNNEGSAEDAFNQLDLTEKQREVCQHLIDCRDKQDFEYGTHAYIAGLMDAFHIMAVLFPEKWDTERINPLSAEWVTDAVGSDDYLEAMQIFTDRVREQIESVRAEQEQFKFDMTPFTIDDCIPDDKSGSIVGKVVVINAEVNRHEYRHSAYQLVLADGGHGALGGRGQAVFGTSLADGKHARWERCDVLGEIKPEKMPVWAKEALAKIQSQEKAKKSKSREER